MRLHSSLFKGLRPLPPAPLSIGDLVTTGLAGLVGLAGLAGLAGLVKKKRFCWSVIVLILIANLINLGGKSDSKFDQFG